MEYTMSLYELASIAAEANRLAYDRIVAPLLFASDSLTSDATADQRRCLEHAITLAMDLCNATSDLCLHCED